MDFCMFNMFKWSMIIFSDAQIVPDLANENPLKLAALVFRHDSISL